MQWELKNRGSNIQQQKPNTQVEAPGGASQAQLRRKGGNQG